MRTLHRLTRRCMGVLENELTFLFAFVIGVVLSLLGCFCHSSWVADAKAVLILFLVPLIFRKVVDIAHIGKVGTQSFHRSFELMANSSVSRHFKTVKIFAYSAENYIQKIRDYKFTIDCLELLLHRVDSHGAWFMRDKDVAERYNKELSRVLQRVRNLSRVKKVCIRFYDFDSYSHFGIFESNYSCYLLKGLLVPNFKKEGTVSILDTQLFGSTIELGTSIAVIEAYTSFFQRLFKVSSVDSGLQERLLTCSTCAMVSTVLSPSFRTIRPDEKYHTVLAKKGHYLVLPDKLPISKVHLLVFSDYHVLSMFDALKRSEDISNILIIVQATLKAIREILKDEKIEILVFEHGTSASDSKTGCSSVNHMHLHIIIKKDGYLDKVIKECKLGDASPFVLRNEIYCFDSLATFRDSDELRNRDYFLVWDPSINKGHGKDDIRVFLPQSKKSQFLRRIFCEMLDSTERANLGLGVKLDKEGVDCSYDWKTSKIEWTDNLCLKYQAIGEKIQTYCSLSNVKASEEKGVNESSIEYSRYIWCRQNGSTEAQLNKVATQIQKAIQQGYCSANVRDALLARRNKKNGELRKWLLLAKYSHSGESLLDCGFGSGRDLLIAAERGYKVFGCELCDKYYYDFISNYPSPQGNIRHEDMRELSFDNESFDIVRHNASFLHMPLIGPGYTIHKVFEESWRVLKHGGIIYIYTKAGEGFCLIDTGEGFGPRPFQLFTKELLSKVLRECGFSLEYIEIIEKERVVRQADGTESRQVIPWVEVVARKT